VRASYASWPDTAASWARGFALSLPLAAALWLVAGQAEGWRNAVAIAAVLLAVPWVVPATVLLGALSVPLYMWLHTQGPVVPVLDWLGGVVLVAAVVGAHINAAVLAACWRARRYEPEPGLREFLGRSVPGSITKPSDKA
jgi:hypothetical protein